MMVVWIFSAIIVSFDWISRICGPIWIEILVAGRLGVLRQLGALGLGCGFGQAAGTHIGQLFASGQDVHRQFLEIDKVQLVHFVQHCNVLHQGNLVVFQLGFDPLDIHVGFFILGFEVFNVGLLLFEKAEKALALFGCIKTLQFADQVGDQFAGFPHILGFDTVEGVVRKIAEFFLAGRAVLQHHLAVGDVDLFGKIIDHLLLFGGQRGVFHLEGRGLFGFLHHFLVRFRVERQGGGRGIQRQGRGGRNVQIKIIRHRGWLLSGNL